MLPSGGWGGGGGGGGSGGRRSWWERESEKKNLRDFEHFKPKWSTFWDPGNLTLLNSLKCSKSRRFLGLRPRPRWGSLRRSLRPPNREALLAFGKRPLSSAPSTVCLPMFFPNKTDINKQ